MSVLGPFREAQIYNEEPCLTILETEKPHSLTPEIWKPRETVEEVLRTRVLMV